MGKNRGRGTTLCVKHARQATSGTAPSGECEPSSTWQSGDGAEITCDVIAAPERVAAYVAMTSGRAEQTVGEVNDEPS